jgi:hypothetical protein
MKTLTFIVLIALIALFVSLPNYVLIWVYAIGAPSALLLACYVCDKKK